MSNLLYKFEDIIALEREVSEKWIFVPNFGRLCRCYALLDISNRGGGGDKSQNSNKLSELGRCLLNQCDFWHNYSVLSWLSSITIYLLYHKYSVVSAQLFTAKSAVTFYPSQGSKSHTHGVKSHRMIIHINHWEFIYFRVLYTKAQRRQMMTLNTLFRI